MAPVISWVEVIGAFCVIWILKIKESSRCMYISTLKLLNFRSFKGEQEFHFTDGKNFVVGNNNVGKTTIFEAVDFLFNDLKIGLEISYWKIKIINFGCEDLKFIMDIFKSEGLFISNEYI